MEDDKEGMPADSVLGELEATEEIQMILNGMSEKEFNKIKYAIEPMLKGNSSPSYFDTIATELAGAAQQFHDPVVMSLFAVDEGPECVCFEEVIEQGLVAVFDVSGPENGWKNAATFALHIFCQNMTARLHLQYPQGKESRKINQERPVVLCADEFHIYARSGRGTGLAHFLATSRSSGCIALLAAQSIGLIHKAFGSAADCDMLMSNLATRIFGTNTGLDTNHLSSQLCGFGEVTTQTNRGISFFASSGVKEILETKRTSRGALVNPEEFSALQAGQYLVRRYDNTVGFWDLRWNAKEKGFDSRATAQGE